MRIITRREWGARYQDGFDDRPLPARYVWLHHSVTHAPPAIASQEEDAAAVRQLEDIGQQRFGGGISYTYVVLPSGRVFQGHSISRQGSHTKNHNDDSVGIVLVGDYQTTPLSFLQTNALVWLVMRLYGRDLITIPQITGGHRDAEPPGYTECPGDAAENVIPILNSTIRNGGYPPEDDMAQIDSISPQAHDQIADAVLFGILKAVRHPEIGSRLGKVIDDAVTDPAEVQSQD